jgi:hypothetical protein
MLEANVSVLGLRTAAGLDQSAETMPGFLCDQALRVMVSRQ